MYSKAKKIAIVSLLCVVCLAFVCFFGSKYLYEKNYEAYYLDALETAFQSDNLNLKVNIDCQEIEYHHLGRDICREYFYNSNPISSGDIIPAAGDLTFTARITEQDKIPDTGENSVDMKLEPPYQQTAIAQIRVDEKGGTRYKDAYALYEVSFSVEPVTEDLKIGYWEVVFHSWNK